jgi:hypothetical protein
MADGLNEKWSKATQDMQPEQRQLLLALKRDYEAASAVHVPNYKGGPNAGILAELIRMGWRKAV